MRLLPDFSAMSSYFFFALLAAWVSADPATDFTAGDVFGLLKSFDAFVAMEGDVFSFEGFLVAMFASLGGGWTVFVRSNVRAKRATTAGRQARAMENVHRTRGPGLVACSWRSA